MKLNKIKELLQTPKELEKLWLAYCLKSNAETRAVSIHLELILEVIRTASLRQFSSNKLKHIKYVQPNIGCGESLFWNRSHSELHILSKSLKLSCPLCNIRACKYADEAAKLILHNESAEKHPIVCS